MRRENNIRMARRLERRRFKDLVDLTWNDDVSETQNGELHPAHVQGPGGEARHTHHHRQLEGTRTAVTLSASGAAAAVDISARLLCDRPAAETHISCHVYGRAGESSTHARDQGGNKRGNRAGTHMTLIFLYIAVVLNKGHLSVSLGLFAGVLWPLLSIILICCNNN